MTNSMADEFSLAMQVAHKAHAGQADRVGADYILHPIAVSSYCKTERGKVAALLHDVVEDTEMTLQGLSKFGFCDEVVFAADCITKRANEPLEAYFNRIALSDIAIEVKFADMRHNSDASRWPDSLKKQALANTAKYIKRMKMLYGLAGSKRAIRCMSGETYRYFLNLTQE